MVIIMTSPKNQTILVLLSLVVFVALKNSSLDVTVLSTILG
ncbi:hypothetical protein VP249E411_P0151 [Vibrio phage 249E41-1]|nr:hypothetical protein VP249E411_P0151 [Vibrio phage 249E41-1]CAH9017161.1 hypothetical protein VP193E371_P0145 [Vibrio phage 193E37-1]